MPHSALTALSPLDGRYAPKLAALRPLLSEYGLMHRRVQVEVEWLIALSEAGFAEFPALPESAKGLLRSLVVRFSEADAQAIKDIEKETNHDVKAVEYWLRQRIGHVPELAGKLEFIHFACTSEDINNTSHALMLKSAREQVVLPAVDGILTRMQRLDSLAAGEGLPEAEFTLMPGTDRRLTVRVSSVRVDVDGEAATLSIITDDTERRAAEDLVRRSETLLSHLVSTSPDWITLTEFASGRYAMVNPTFLATTGYRADEVIGRTPSELGLWADATQRDRIYRMMSFRCSAEPSAVNAMITAKTAAIRYCRNTIARPRRYVVSRIHMKPSGATNRPSRPPTWNTFAAKPTISSDTIIAPKQIQNPVRPAPTMRAAIITGTTVNARTARTTRMNVSMTGDPSWKCCEWPLRRHSDPGRQVRRQDSIRKGAGAPAALRGRGQAALIPA